MTLTPILEGADVDARLRSRRFPFPFILEILATLLIVASILFTSGCVGVAGKPGTSGAGSASIEVSPSTINFGSLTVGQSATKTLTILNSGTKSLSVSGISVAGTGFAVKAPALPLVLAAGQAGNVVTTFTATATGNAAGTIMISSNAPEAFPAAAGLKVALRLALAPAERINGKERAESEMPEPVTDTAETVMAAELEFFS